MLEDHRKQRYRATWANRWLITTHNGYSDIPPIDVRKYPAVKQHLDGFYQKISKRYDKGRTPYNLRNCAYHEHFSREKLFWITLSNRGRFAYFRQSETFCLDSAFMLTGSSVKFLCAALNSKLIQWFMANTAPTSGMGELQWKKTYLQQIPLPRLPSDREASVVKLVESILQAKNNDLVADISKTELEIEEWFCKLYGLTSIEKEKIVFK